MWWSNINISFLFFLVLPTALLAQQGESRFGEFHAGLRLGLCASQIDGDNYGGYNKAGLTAGVLVYTPISQKVEAQMEIAYCNRGSRDPADPDNGKPESYLINLHYIDIPLLFKFRTWRFKFELGFTNSVLVGYSEEDHIGPITNSIFDFRRHELAFNLGANVSIAPRWLFNIRYHRSVLPIANDRVLIPRYGFLGGSYNDAILFNLLFLLKSPAGSG